MNGSIRYNSFILYNPFQEIPTGRCEMVPALYPGTTTAEQSEDAIKQLQQNMLAALKTDHGKAEFCSTPMARENMADFIATIIPKLFVARTEPGLHELDQFHQNIMVF